jgi:hypothetical protein
MAFIKVAMDLFIILKKGSRTGNCLLPHRVVCSKICAIPVESDGAVWKATLRLLLLLLLFVFFWKYKVILMFSELISEFRRVKKVVFVLEDLVRIVLFVDVQVVCACLFVFEYKASQIKVFDV